MWKTCFVENKNENKKINDISWNKTNAFPMNFFIQINDIIFVIF